VVQGCKRRQLAAAAPGGVLLLLLLGAAGLLVTQWLPRTKHGLLLLVVAELRLRLLLRALVLASGLLQHISCCPGLRWRSRICGGKQQEAGIRTHHSNS
jgi:hypothetical protein